MILLLSNLAGAHVPHDTVAAVGAPRGLGEGPWLALADPEGVDLLLASGDRGRTWRTKARELKHPAGEFQPVLGDVRELAQDRLLVSWTLAGQIVVYTADGEPAWTLSAPLGFTTGRVEFLPDLYP